MEQFSYVAVDRKGEHKKGSINAPNESEVRVLLRAQNLRPIKIVKASAMQVDLFKLSFFDGVKIADVLMFTRQLSLMLTSGLPLVDSLEIITAQMKNENLKKTLLGIREKITGGGFLWESMKTYSKVFPEIYVSLVKAGELSGTLDVLLKRLITYMDNSEKLKKLIKGALMYPAIVTIVGLLVMVILLTFVIPKFEEILKSSNQELPELTQIVITISHFFQNNFVYLFLGAVAGVFFIAKFLKTEEGTRFYDFYILKVPVFGELVLKSAIARFARTTQTLLSSGINLLDALEICKTSVGNKLIEESVVKIKNEVEQGRTLSDVMRKIPLYPSMVVEMIAVGEATGNIDKMLSSVADYYEEELNNIVANVSKLIEPVILVVIGGMVAVLLGAMYLPIFKMGDAA